MSAIQSSEVMGISARYAAQIRNLLATQAVQRMAVQQEAARADAESRKSPPKATPSSVEAGPPETGAGLGVAAKTRPAPEVRASEARAAASMDLSLGNGPSGRKGPVLDLTIGEGPTDTVRQPLLDLRV